MERWDRISCVEITLSDGVFSVSRGVAPCINGGKVSSFSLCGVMYINISGNAAVVIPEDNDLFRFKLLAQRATVNLCGIKAVDVSLYIKESDIRTGTIKSDRLYADVGKGSALIKADTESSAVYICGMGEIKAFLGGNESDYRIKTERGIGSITVSDKERPRNMTSGKGKRELFARCGMGRIVFDFRGI